MYLGDLKNFFQKKKFMSTRLKGHRRSNLKLNVDKNGLNLQEKEKNYFKFEAKKMFMFLQVLTRCAIISIFTHYFICTL